MSPILLCLSDVEIIFPFIIHCTSYYLQTFVELLDEAANAPLFHFISHEIKIGADSFQSLIVLRQVTVYDRTKLNLKGSKMAFDFKKEYKEFYMPKNQPEIVNVPKPTILP